jgi:hypothetical protein
MQFGKNYDLVDDEVDDEAQRKQMKIHIDQQKTHRKIHKMIKIQKMSFRATLSIADEEAKNPVIHLWILRINPQNDKKSSVLRTAPLQRSKRMHIHLQKKTESQPKIQYSQHK